MEFKVRSIEELQEVAQWFVKHFPEPRIFLLNGSMGAGKTTLVKTLCAALGAEAASSPTFSIVNEYRSSKNIPIHHFDLYRLKKAEELYDVGFEEYIDQKAYIFIEWPELAMGLLPESCVTISIEDEDGVRGIEFRNAF